MNLTIFERHFPFSKMLLLFFSIHFTSIEALDQKVFENRTIPALIAFGDSILDTGNNNNLLTASKCNFFPYGRDFVGARPTGRFSNGRIPSDLIAEGLGIKNLLPAYRDPNIQDNDLLTGVSFASGGSGLDEITARLLKVVWLPSQLDDFKVYMAKLNGVVGDQERTKSIISSAVYLISAGNNDIAITYFSTLSRISHYDVFSYTNLMVYWTQSFIKNLYDLGARKFAVFGTLPLGCLPGARNSVGGLLKLCAPHVNGAAEMFNAKLSSQLQNLTSSLPGAKFVYVDMYNPLLDLIKNPQISGFDVVADGCCCTRTSLVPCIDASHYVFWDYGHPTEKSYRMIVPKIIEDIKINFA